MLDSTQFQGWVPIRLEWRPTGPELDWCYLGERTFREPFFEQTIRGHLESPYNLVSRQRSGLAELLELAETRPSLPLAGLIFHMSRCGSTLISRMLAGDPANLVLAEAPPIDELLDTARRGVPDDTRIAWLRAMVAALAQPRSGAEQRCLIKLDSWHILDLPLFRRAFPTTPWIFVYREPVEVIVSHQRLRGMQMAPGQLPPARLGLEESAARPPFSLDQFCARVLGNYCAAAATFVPAHAGRLINYSQLPDALWSSVLPRFDLHPTTDQREVMALELQFHAKHPAQPFEPDAEPKRRAASPAQRAFAEQYVAPSYNRLEQLRLAQA